MRAPTWDRRRGRNATRREREAARVGLLELGCRQLRVELAPAPRPMHARHCIRIAVSSNPEWYRELAARGSGQLRARVRRTLELIALHGYVRPAPWSMAEELLRLLVPHVDELRHGGAA